MSFCSQAKRHELIPMEMLTDTDIISIEHDEQQRHKPVVVCWKKVDTSLLPHPLNDVTLLVSPR
jgi:hypothetical protein